MEESLSDALLAAGEKLAQAIGTGLSAESLPNKLNILVEEGRVLISSCSDRVREAELGTPGKTPRAIMEGIARDVLPTLVKDITIKVRDILE